MAELEAARPWRRQPLFLLDTDHRARLRGNFESLLLEQHLAAHRAEQSVVAITHRIGRIVPRDNFTHGIDQIHFGAQGEGLLDHDRGTAPGRARQKAIRETQPRRPCDRRFR